METVIVVDDSTEQLALCELYLKEKYKVICCESGIQALRYIQEDVPSLVLLDIEMPYMDGFETLRRIRELEKGLNIPVVGLTGNNSKSAVLRFIGHGGSGYVTKPVTKERLLSMVDTQIKTALDKKREHKILLVDDDMNALRIIKGFLKEKYIVTALNSCKLAIDYLYKYKPELIMLDYHMAPYNGAVMFDIIRKMEGREDIPIIFITGENDRDIILKCTSMGPADIILKPVNKEMLLERVAKVFKK